ncbi:MAG: outer membrane beta-barrel protein [Methylotenera sp.]
MKSLFLSLLLVAGLFSSSVLAAENSWTGFYVGANLGYADGDADAVASLGGLWSTQPQTLRDFIVSNSSKNQSPSGVGFGVQLGYDYQLANKFVLGLEADYTKLNMDESRQTAPITYAFGLDYSFSNKVDVDHVFSLRPKLGYAFDNTMIYATVGYAWTSADFSSDLLSNVNYSKVGKKSKTLGSAIFGIGAEHKFFDNISMKLEYLKINGDDTSYTTVYRTSAFPGYIETFNVDLDYDVIRAGINYRF